MDFLHTLLTILRLLFTRRLRMAEARSRDQYKQNKSQQQAITYHRHRIELRNIRHQEHISNLIIDHGVDSRGQDAQQCPEEHPSAAISLSHVCRQRNHPDEILRTEYLSRN